MATLEDILAATKALAEKSDDQNGASKMDDSNVKKDHASTAVTNEQIVEKETIVEPSLDSNRCLGKIEKEKVVVENSSHQVHVEVIVDGKVEDGKASWTDNGGIGGNDGNKSDVTEGNSLSADMEGYKKGQKNGGKMEHLDHGFCVGDFVWGKIKSHPWWPGRIFNPMDASDFAMKRRQEGRLLVAFFGDGSCSWCSPSQLKPFVENFEEMSVGSNSKSFVNAVQSAVEDIGRLMESEMTCACVPLEKRGGLAQQLVVNAGIKDGVLAPDVEIRRLCMPEYAPSGILTRVMHFAKAVSVDNAYALAVLRSWLSAFYRAKGVYPLPVYCEPLNIDGMEDKNKTSGKGVEDFSVPIEVPILGPREDDWASPTKSQASSGDKIYHRRKQKSVAEIMGKTSNDNTKSLDKTTIKEGKSARKLTSSKKKKKNIDEEVDKGMEEPLTRRLGGKRKVEAPESSKTATKKASNAENRDSGDNVIKRTSSRKPKRVASDDSDSSSGEAKEEQEIVTSPRERKKSKYLCPPYTTPSWRTGNSSFKLGAVPGNSSFKLGTVFDKTTKVDTLGGRTAEASGGACDSESVSKSIDKPSDEKVSDGNQDQIDASVKEGTRGLKEDKEIGIPASDVDMPVDELVSKIQAAALNPFFLSNEGCLDMVWSFVSALRSAIYLHGSNYKVYNKRETGGKSKLLKSKQGNQENGERVKSADKKMHEGKKTDKKLDSSKSKSKKATVILDGNASSFTSKKGNQENDVAGKEVKSAGKKRREEKKAGKTPVSSKYKSKKTSEILEGNASSGTSKQENQKNDLLDETSKLSKKRKREEMKMDKRPDSTKSKKAMEGFDGNILSRTSKQGNQENDRSDNKFKSGEQRTCEEKMEGKPESSKSKKVSEVLDGNSSCLVLKFIPEYPLPSKEEIVKLFGKYGKLNKKETRVVTDSHTVRIVYKDDSDTKAAFKASVSENPFGDKNVVSYWLELQSPAGSKSTPRKRGSKKLNSSQMSDDLLLDVRVIREKIDGMTATLENYRSKFSANEISGLRAEMRNLLQNVETTGEKVRVLAENYPA